MPATSRDRAPLRSLTKLESMMTLKKQKVGEKWQYVAIRDAQIVWRSRPTKKEIKEVILGVSDQGLYFSIEKPYGNYVVAKLVE